MIKPTLNSITIREIIKVCDALGLSVADSLEIINRIITEKLLPGLIDDDAITVSKIRYHKHKERIYKDLDENVKGSIYSSPQTVMMLTYNPQITPRVHKLVLSLVTERMYNKAHRKKDLIESLKLLKLNVVKY